MTDRALTLAGEFETVHVQVVQAVTEASPEQWAAVMAGEQWPAGFGFYHIADGYALVYDWIQAAVSGRGPTVLDPATNAVSFAAHAQCSRDEVLALLNERGARLTELVGGLTDEQMALAALTLPDGTTRNIEAVASGPMLRHSRAHLASINAAAGVS